MCSKVSKIFIIVLMSLMFCFKTSQGFHRKPDVENFRRNKRGHTTVCVEIKPNGSGIQEQPYYMCESPQFAQRQPNNIPPHVFNTNSGNYPPTMTVGIKTTNKENYQHSEVPQNLQFKNFYQQPQQQYNAENHARFATENQQPLHVPGALKTNGQNYQSIPPAQSIQFGNGQPTSTQPQHKSAVTKTTEENRPNMPSQLHDYSFNPNMANPMHDYSFNPNMGNQQMHPNNPNIANHLYNSEATPQNFQNLPKNLKSPQEASTLHFQNGYENIPKPATTESFKSQNSRSDISRVERNESDLNNFRPLALNEALKHNINSEKFKALIENEVVGSPNLNFSHDEMLPIHNMFSDSKLDERLRLPLEDSLIPPEYLDDPILRTFYNMDDNSNKYQEDPYSPPLSQPAVGNANDCFDQGAPLIGPTSYMPPAVSDFHIDDFKLPQFNAHPCCGCPLAFQGIFIAVPWFNSPYQELCTHMQPAVYGHLPPKNNYGYTLPQSISAHSRANEDSFSSAEDLTNKKLTTPEMNTQTTQQPPTITTKSSRSSEEEEDDDLFAEDTTVKNDQVTKNSKEDSEEETDADDGDQEDNLKISTTSVPFTTVKTFKTMMHAAKMHSMLASGKSNPLQPLPNKRQVHYMAAPVFPHNFKRQYVRKLEKMYN